MKCEHANSNKAHRLRLLRHRLVALQRVLAPGALAVEGPSLQRPAPQVAGARPQRGAARAPARPALLVRRGSRRAQGAPAHAEPQRDLAHGAGRQVRRRGHRWLADLAGRVQVDGRRAVSPQRRVVEEHSQRRRREGDKFVAADMVDLLLELADDPNLKVPIKRDGVKGFALVRLEDCYSFIKLNVHNITKNSKSK